jgi:hypothetical protein
MVIFTYCFIYCKKSFAIISIISFLLQEFPFSCWTDSADIFAGCQLLAGSEQTQQRLRGENAKGIFHKLIELNITTKAQPTMLQLTTPRLPSTTPPRHRSTTRLRMLPQPITPRLPSITQLPATTPRFQLITPPKRLNTTPSRPSTTPPRLQSITPQLMLPRATTPMLQSTTLYPAVLSYFSPYVTWC